MNIEKIKEMLFLHEDYRQFPYKDTNGIWSIGLGTNLKSDGITKDQAWYIANDKVSSIKDALHNQLNFFDSLDDVRQAVLIDISYNCGTHGLMGFVDMLHALSMGNYSKAADEIIDSTIVESRKNRIAKMMRSGDWWTA